MSLNVRRWEGGITLLVGPNNAGEGPYCIDGSPGSITEPFFAMKFYRGWYSRRPSAGSSARIRSSAHPTTRRAGIFTHRAPATRWGVGIQMEESGTTDRADMLGRPAGESRITLKCPLGSRRVRLSFMRAWER